MTVTADFLGQVVMCPHCGKQMSIPPLHRRPEESPGSYEGPRIDPPSYLLHAILVTIFCCNPFGVVAIAFAAQVNARLMAQDYVGANYVSEHARNWCWVSFVCGLVLWTIGILVYVLRH